MAVAPDSSLKKREIIFIWVSPVLLAHIHPGQSVPTSPEVTPSNTKSLSAALKRMLNYVFTWENPEYG
jgi:hypothetical protein